MNFKLKEFLKTEEGKKKFEEYLRLNDEFDLSGYDLYDIFITYEKIYEDYNCSFDDSFNDYAERLRIFKGMEKIDFGHLKYRVLHKKDVPLLIKYNIPLYPNCIFERDLVDLKLRGANVLGEFTGCDISGVDFTGSKNALIDLDCVKYDGKTNFTDAKILKKYRSFK